MYRTYLFHIYVSIYLPITAIAQKQILRNRRNRHQCQLNDVPGGVHNDDDDGWWDACAPLFLAAGWLARLHIDVY